MAYRAWVAALTRSFGQDTDTSSALQKLGSPQVFLDGKKADMEGQNRWGAHNISGEERGATN